MQALAPCVSLWSQGHPFQSSRFLFCTSWERHLKHELDIFQSMHSLGSPQLIFRSLRASLFGMDLGTGVPACQEQLCVTGEIFISCQFNNRSFAHSQNWLLNLAGVLTARSWKMRLSTWKGPRQKPKHPKNVLRSSGTLWQNQRFVFTVAGQKQGSTKQTAVPLSLHLGGMSFSGQGRRYCSGFSLSLSYLLHTIF